MTNEMISYLQQLEMVAFFSGYPFIYAVVAYLKSTAKFNSSIKNSAFILLPFTYAIVGILYAGLQIKNLYPDYSITHITSEIQVPFYVSWALLSLLFLIPFFNKKPLISLLHSLVFFYLIVKNFYVQLTGAKTDKNVLRNFMNVYIDSILLNTAILILLLIIYYAIRFLRRSSSFPN